MSAFEEEPGDDGIEDGIVAKEDSLAIHRRGMYPYGSVVWSLRLRSRCWGNGMQTAGDNP